MNNSSDSDPMELEQRKIGVRLAVENEAPQTLALIKDPNSTAENILKTAASELGTDKVASILLNEDPILAHYALRYLPDLGERREALIAKAGELVQADDRSVGTSAIAALQPVGGMELYLARGAAFEASFTMFWLSAPNVIQPQAGTPDHKKWKWSIKLSISINRSWSLPCSHFALPNSPLAKGDTVWMNVAIKCAKWHQPPFRFRYDPDAPFVQIDTWGVVTGPKFAVHKPSS